MSADKKPISNKPRAAQVLSYKQSREQIVKMTKLEKNYELVAAHISHDAYGYKFNHEGHVFDEDLFYNMKQPLYSPLMGWLTHEMDLKVIQHRPLLPGNVSYYGLAPYNDEFKTFGERHSASLQRMASRGNEIATGLVYCNLQNNNQTYCPNRLVANPLAGCFEEQECPCQEPLKYDVHTLNMPSLTKITLYHLAEYDCDFALDSKFKEELRHAAQDEEIYLDDLSLDIVQQISTKYGPGMNFVITGTGPRDQMAEKLGRILDDAGDEIGTSQLSDRIMVPCTYKYEKPFAGFGKYRRMVLSNSASQQKLTIGDKIAYQMTFTGLGLTIRDYKVILRCLAKESKYDMSKKPTPDPVLRCRKLEIGADLRYNDDFIVNLSNM